METHACSMRQRAPLLVAVLVLAVALSGCSGGGDASSSSTSGITSSSSTSSSTTTAPEVVTVTRTITVGGSTTTVTSTMTQTATSGPPAAGPTPAVANVTVTPAANSVLVAWDTYGGVATLASKAEAAAGTSTNFTFVSPTQSGAGEHSATISGLASCTTYKVRVAVTDGAGTTVRSAGTSVTTLPGAAMNVPPASIVVPPANVVDKGFRVTWSVSGPEDIVSRVQYGTTTAYGAQSAPVAGIGAKSADLTGLSPGTAYNLRIVVAGTCGTFQSVNLVQKTATVHHVDINPNAVSSGSLNAFTPGSTLSGELVVAANKPLVFDVTNDDSLTHTFDIKTSTGADLSPAYGSGSIAAGATKHFDASIILPPGDYQMRCNLHSGMRGMISAE